MCTADDSKLHSSIALHRTELLKSHSQELLLYSRNNILDSSKILHYFGEEFTIAWENSTNSHTKYIGQYEIKDYIISIKNKISSAHYGVSH